MTSELSIEAELDSLDFENNTATFAVSPEVRWTGGKYYITSAALATQPSVKVSEEVQKPTVGALVGAGDGQTRYATDYQVGYRAGQKDALKAVQKPTVDEVASCVCKALNDEIESVKIAQALRNAFPQMFRG